MRKGRIVSICEVLEQTGPASARTLMGHFPDIGLSTIHKYCVRAVEKQMLTVSTEPCKYGAINIYSVSTNWRNPTASRSKWQGVNSVFGMGA